MLRGFSVLFFYYWNNSNAKLFLDFKRNKVACSGIFIIFIWFYCKYYVGLPDPSAWVWNHARLPDPDAWVWHVCQTHLSWGCAWLPDPRLLSLTIMPKSNLSLAYLPYPSNLGLTSLSVFLCFKNIFKKLFLFTLNYYFLFSNQFDFLMLKINFLKLIKIYYF
jgi:hypothetical protein